MDIMQTSIKQMLASPKLHIKSTSDELTICRKGNAHVKLVICNEFNFNSSLDLVLLGLIELGQQQSQKNDVKSMADTWKQLSKLAIEFRRVYESLQYQEQMEMSGNWENILDWIELFIQTICELITANVQKVLEVRNGSFDRKFRLEIIY